MERFAWKATVKEGKLEDYTIPACAYMAGDETGVERGWHWQLHNLECRQ
jgi:hypothetical protein